MSAFNSIINQPVSHSSPSTSSALGRLGESLAIESLKSKGYRIVLTNFRVPIGRNSKGVQVTGEIDVIALDGEVLCFIEVKARRSEDFAPAIAAVNARKQRQIIRTAKVYRRIFGLEDREVRYDVVTVLLPEREAPKIEIATGFWSEAKFRKRRWGDPAWDA